MTVHSKKKYFIYIIIIILITIFIFYIVYNQKDNKSITNKSTTKTTIKENNNDINVNITELFSSYNIFNNWLDLYINETISDNYYNNNTNLFDFKYSYFYDNNISSGKISEAMKFALAVGNLYIKDSKFEFNDDEELDINKINEMSTKLFGSSINYDRITDSKNNIIISVRGYRFKYDDNKKSVVAYISGIGDATTMEYYTKIIDEKRMDGKVEVTSTVLYKICMPGDDYCYVSNRSRDTDDLNDLVDKVPLDSEINIEKYIDNLYIYKWVFIRSGNNYIFDSVEKISKE